MNKLPSLCLLAGLSVASSLFGNEKTAQNETDAPRFFTDKVVWGKQIGSTGEEFLSDVNVDSQDNVYIIGSTTGAMNGDAFGKKDVFFIKYTSDGEELYRRQFGTAEDDDGHYILCDSEDNVIVTGATSGLLGEQQVGGRDIYVAKYTPEGDLLWITQYGSDQDDQGSCITLDDEGNIYVAGGTTGLMGKEAFGKQDGVVTKLNSDGKVLWNAQFGTPELEFGRGICLDSRGMVYAVSSFYMTDISSIVKLSPATGDILQQKDPTDIKMMDVYTNAEDEIYVAGHNKGISMFRKLDKDFNPLWVKTFTQGSWSGEKEIQPYKGNLYATSGCMNWPNCGGFVRIYDGDGNLQDWVMIRKSPDLESEESSCGNFLTVDSKGAIYHVGGTKESLFGPKFSEKDAFLCKIEL